MTRTICNDNSASLKTSVHSGLGWPPYSHIIAFYNLKQLPFFEDQFLPMDQNSNWLLNECHCVLAPLISGIYKGLSTGSELQWGNWAPHSFQLQGAVAPRKKIICFFGIWIFWPEVSSTFWQNWTQTIFWPIFDRAQSHFWQNFGVIAWLLGSNDPLVLLINPWKFQDLPNTGKKSPSQKPKHIWAKFGYARNA